MHALRVMRSLLIASMSVSLIQCSGTAGSHALPSSNGIAARRVAGAMDDGGGCPTYPDGSLAVLDNYYGKIYFFDGPVSGSSSPTATITLPTHDDQEIAGMTFDPSGNLWIAYTASIAGFAGVLEYAAPLTTGESPSIDISGSNTGFVSPRAISFNASTSNIYVLDSNSSGAIDVFTDTADGNVAPSTIISGSNTGLAYTSGSIKTDANYIYVPGSSPSYGIKRFNITASGNSYPHDTLLSGSTTVGGQFDIDTAKDIYSSPGSEMWIYAPVSGYSYSHGQYDTPSLARGIAVDDSGYIYGLEGGGDSLYIFSPIDWTSSTGTMTTLTVGYQDNALAIFSPGKFSGTEPQ